MDAEGGLQLISITVISLYQDQHKAMREPMGRGRGRSWGRELKPCSSCSSAGTATTGRV